MPFPEAVAGGSTSTGKPKGRPRKLSPKGRTSRTIPIIHKIMAAVNNHPGEPILYASTTKGTVKLVVDGHHFRYSFRKGKYTIFQCCYKEGKEECTVRVVTDQKRVFPLDGEHVHFMQATDKSVTSVKFAPGEDSEEAERQEFLIDDAVSSPKICEEVQNVYKDDSPTVDEDDDVCVVLPEKVNIKQEANTSQEIIPIKADSPQVGSIVTLPTSTMSAEESNEFREKIKKRLQKALLGKKK